MGRVRQREDGRGGEFRSLPALARQVGSFTGLAAFTLALALLGLMLTFSDLGPGETLPARSVVAATFFAAGGYTLGYLAPRHWLLSLIPALGGLMMVFPVPLTVAAAYAGARWRRRQQALPGTAGDLPTALVVNAGFCVVTAYLMLVHRLSPAVLLPGALAVGVLAAWAPFRLIRSGASPLGWDIRSVPAPGRAAAAVAVVALGALGLLLAAVPEVAAADRQSLAAAVLLLAAINGVMGRIWLPSRGNEPDL